MATTAWEEITLQDGTKRRFTWHEIFYADGKCIDCGSEVRRVGAWSDGETAVCCAGCMTDFTDLYEDKLR